MALCPKRIPVGAQKFDTPGYRLETDSSDHDADRRQQQEQPNGIPASQPALVDQQNGDAGNQQG